MNQNEMAKVMEQVFTECSSLRSAGQKEYAHEDSNAFRNFEDTGKDVGLSREKVLWVFAKKHIDGIASWINGHRSQRESVNGRINDLIVYLVLLRGMSEESPKGFRAANPQDHIMMVDENYLGRPGAQTATLGLQAKTCSCKDERVAKIDKQTWRCEACGLVLK